MALLRILCWTLIFLTRLRFPPGKSIAIKLKIIELEKKKIQLALFLHEELSE